MIAALVLAVATTTAPTTDLSDAEIAEVRAQAVADAAAVVDELERAVSVREARLALCRRSTTGDEVDWYPANVQEAVGREPQIGPTADVLEICQAYLHGRQDQLREILDQ